MVTIPPCLNPLESGLSVQMDTSLRLRSGIYYRLNPLESGLSVQINDAFSQATIPTRVSIP